MVEVLILHGWQNHRPDGHWQRWLAEELTARGHVVRYPQLPDADEPTREGWLAALEAELAETSRSELTIVAHSLGCSLWLAYAIERARAVQPGPDATGPAAARVMLVAPPSDGFLEQTPEIAGFVAGGTDTDDDARAGVAAALAAASLEAPIVVQSDADPCSPAGTTSFADAFELDRVIVPGGGHLTIEDGFGPFPLLLDLVLEVESTTASWETRAR